MPPIARRSVVQTRRRCAFTLIELMVVIAVILLLIGILLPSLRKARDHAKAVSCSTNLHHVGLAMSDYLYSSKGVYPPSYVYPSDADGRWAPETQSEGREYGYMHWSYFLYDSGEVNDKAFQCPDFEHGGAPRTNPGLKREDWEERQVDDQGDRGASDRVDKQAPRIAYGANAAIMPRNKFNTTLSGGSRVNVFVREPSIKHAGSTILATEYLNNWKGLGVEGPGGILSKSHRPINPFFHVGSGANEYAAAPNAPGFLYGLPNDQDFYGLLPLKDVRERANILDYTSGVPQINAVGRHHPTADKIYSKKFGGAANFLYCDSHVESMTPLESVVRRQWGTHYYSLSGQSQILNMGSVAGQP
ncbi:MAG: prepilin-type N-terminal cleavage/methylation domain-containing protein [Planctomycetota bacterium]